MRKIYYSKNIYESLLIKLKAFGKQHEFQLAEIAPALNLSGELKNHPDLAYCGLKDGEVFHGDAALLKADYPGDCIYNACATGKYFIHNLSVTDERLLLRVQELGLELVDVKQGYARCSTVPVSEDAIITYDRGIAKAADAAGLDILLVEPGHIELPGYSTGFIGGTCGVVRTGRCGTDCGADCEGALRNELASGACFFNGSLDSHPDGGRIRAFLKSHGLDVIETEEPLKDIGSIVFEYENHEERMDIMKEAADANAGSKAKKENTQ